jgi:hypothetical protein
MPSIIMSLNMRDLVEDLGNLIIGSKEMKHNE